MDFKQLLVGAPLVADGAMGTLLIDAGLRLGEAAEWWNLLPERQTTVRAIHRAYCDAGAQLVLTNTFGGNPIRLRHAGLEDRLDEVNRTAAALARDAVGARAVIAGSIGPTGEQPGCNGGLSYAEAEAGFAAQAAALAAGGVDLFWIETMGDPGEAHAAVMGARRAAPALPVVVTCAFGAEGRTYAGATPSQVAAALRDLDLAAVGANCGDGPAATEQAVAALHCVLPGVPLVAKSNLGMPVLHNDCAVYDVSPEAFAAHARRAHAAGAAIIGGCCGSTPEHIRAIANALGR